MLSAPIVVVPAADEPVSMEDARAFLRLEGPDFDLEIEGYIAAARARVEAITGVRMMRQTVDVLADSFADLVHLHVGPVSAIVSIDVQAPDGTTSAVPVETVELSGAGIERGIRAAFGSSFPAVRSVSGAIRVRLEVGYSAETLPRDLRWAMLAVMRGMAEEIDVSIEPLIVNHRIVM